ncbi:MAG TPA: CPBP family intramembrane glutamic endopeptidase [Bacteroidia bacterium]|nr:CPBP family intramembrane glutamic endopeptidase [Bacteroidia bacterium]
MRVWLLVSLYFACIGLLTMLARVDSLRWIGGDDTSVTMGRIALVFQSIILFAIPAVVFANVFPHDRFSFFRLGVKVKWMQFFFGVLAMIVIVPGVDWTYELLRNAMTDPDLKAIQEMGEKSGALLERMPHLGDLFACLFVSALVPAVCEELFFRACIQQSLKEWIGKPHLAVIITALFFSMLHFNPAGIAGIFISGLMLGYAFEWTGSLRINIAMHFFFNATSLFEEYLAEHSKAVADWVQPVWFSSLSLILGVAVFLMLGLQTGKKSF